MEEEGEEEKEEEEEEQEGLVEVEGLGGSGGWQYSAPPHL